jgi:hypothetical protein
VAEHDRYAGEAALSETRVAYVVEPHDNRVIRGRDLGEREARPGRELLPWALEMAVNVATFDVLRMGSPVI